MKMKIARLVIKLIALAAFAQFILAVSLFEQPDWEPSWLAMQIPMWIVSLAWIYAWGTSESC